MPYVRSVIVDIMRSWVGKKQSDRSHRSIIDIYNTISPLPRGYKMTYADPWCAACVSAAFQSAGYTSIYPVECSCYCMMEGAKKKNIWVEADDYIPKPGDAIMYDWEDDGKGDNKGLPNHVGIVELVENGKITVIDGNCDHAVKRRTIEINGKYIRGFITPKYTADLLVPRIKAGTKMKYSDSNPPEQCFMTQSTWYNGAKTNGKPVGILWHDTAAGNPTLKRYVQPDDNAPDKEYWLKKLGVNKYHDDFNHISISEGFNCWIGKLADGSVSTVQTGPWTTHPWGCGSSTRGSCNGYTKSDGKTVWETPLWVQFEICDDGYKDPNYFSVAYEEACQITAYICKKFNIDPKGTYEFAGVKVPTILCHADSHKYKLGSDHGDVYEWFNKYGITMDDVREDVAILLKSGEIPEPTPHTFEVGEVVDFTGNVYYNSANIMTPIPCKSGKATITQIYQLGKSKHPYHLIAVSGGNSTVYGWVDEQYVKEIPKQTDKIKEVVATQQVAYGPDSKLAGKYITTASTSIRNGASLKYKALTTLPKNVTATNYGYYNLSGNTKWLYMQLVYKNVQYTGYMCETYIKKQ